MICEFTEPQTSLEKLARLSAGSYGAGVPYPHIVIDDFLPPDVAEQVWRSFPNPDLSLWKRNEYSNSKKFSCNTVPAMPFEIQQVLAYFNSPGFLGFLEELTGIAGLVGDPDYEGGGMHLIKTGGYLKVHADFNVHPRLQLDRRLNMLFYLNKDWKDEYGGHFELWDPSMSACIRRVAPVFNRCVIFSTTDHSYHGHPDPMNSPPDVFRKSLATYYYTAGRPQEEQSAPHSTLYRNRPGESTPSLPSRALQEAVRLLPASAKKLAHRLIHDRS